MQAEKQLGGLLSVLNAESLAIGHLIALKGLILTCWIMKDLGHIWPEI